MYIIYDIGWDSHMSMVQNNSHVSLRYRFSTTSHGFFSTVSANTSKSGWGDGFTLMIASREWSKNQKTYVSDAERSFFNLVGEHPRW